MCDIEALLGNEPALSGAMGAAGISGKAVRRPLGMLHVDSPNAPGITRKGKTKIPTAIKLPDRVTPTRSTSSPVQLPLAMPASDGDSGAHAATPTDEQAIGNPSKEEVQDAVKQRVAELTKAYPKVPIRSVIQRPACN